MIRFDRVTFTYPGADRPVLRSIELGVDEGELCLVIGATGNGKSTLLRAVNGLVPRFSGGTLAGIVEVAGRTTADHDIRQLAGVVGYVAQDPTSGFVAETVEDELAYTMEQLGVDPRAMRKRVEETLDLLGLAQLRHRRVRSLSAGEAQRVAIGSVLTAHPSVLVLDEPTSALDPVAAEDVLAAVARLVSDLGMTVLMAEHRLERVIQHADRIASIDGDGGLVSGPAREIMEQSPIAPPIVELGRLAGWTPLPLTVREARRHSGALRSRLAGQNPGPARPGRAEVALLGKGILVTHGATVAVAGVDVTLGKQSVTALMGRNGAGKSSLLWALAGAGPRRGGTVDVAGHDPGDLDSAAARALVGLVPQNAGDLLYLETVAGECDQADRVAGTPPGTCAALLGRLVEGVDPHSHPADLSEGERLALVLAVQLTARPEVVLLDEPTRGLDYAAKDRLAATLRDLGADGAAVVVATHDVEFVAGVADRVLVMAEGEIVADGSTAEVVVASPAFAPQVAKVLSPLLWLTVAEVRAILEAR